MSSTHDEPSTVRSEMVQKEPLQEPEHTSLGQKVKHGLSGATSVVHGIGEIIRGNIIDIADLGQGTGKTIAKDGKTEVREGTRELHK